MNKIIILKKNDLTWKEALGKINEALEYFCETDIIYDYTVKIKSEGKFCGASNFKKKTTKTISCPIVGIFLAHVRIQVRNPHMKLLCSYSPVSPQSI